MKQISCLDLLKRIAILTSGAAHPRETCEAIQQVLNNTNDDNLRNTLERFRAAREKIC